MAEVSGRACPGEPLALSVEKVQSEKGNLGRGSLSLMKHAREDDIFIRSSVRQQMIVYG